MDYQMQNRTCTSQINTSILCTLCCFGLLLFWPDLAHAQRNDGPHLRIADVNVDNFPVVQVAVYGNQLGASTEMLNLKIEEEGSERPILNKELVEVGIQSAILVDIDRNLWTQDGSGTSPLAEVSNSAGRFVQMGLLSAYTDWLAAYMVSPSSPQIHTIAGWQQDHQAVVNSLIQLRPQNTPANPSLLDLIQFGLSQFDRSPAPANAARSLVIFSNSGRPLSDAALEEITQLARQRRVRIHAISLGLQQGVAEPYLSQLAASTDGLFIQPKKIEDTEALWRDIAAERTQLVLSYRMATAQPETLKVSAALSGGHEIADAAAFPPVNALPVDITILAPVTGQTLLRHALETSSASGKTSELPISIAFTWPDNHPRTLRQVSVSLNDETRLIETAPFDRMTLPLSSNDDGSHTIRIEAVDELGLTGKADPVSFSVESSITGEINSGLTAVTHSSIQKEERVAIRNQGGPAEGVLIAALPLPDSVEINGQIIQLNLATAGVLALPLIIVVAGAVILATRERTLNPYAIDDSVVSSRLTTAHQPGHRNSVSQNESTSTLPIIQRNNASHRRINGFKPAAASDQSDSVNPTACLTLAEGGPLLPVQLPLKPHREFRVGRHSSYSDIIIDDKRVSRQHATIAWHNEWFSIRDEGSAGGTYLNRRRLEMGEEPPLRNGDIINFNEIAYIYQEDVEVEDELVEAQISQNE